MASTLGDLLPSPPNDGITSVRFSTESELLLASSWDRTVRLYDTASSTLRHTYPQPAPVLDVAFMDDTTAFSGGLDGQLRRLSLQQPGEDVVGSHRGPIRCVEFLRSKGLVVSGSWDSSLRLWDPRTSACVQVVNLPGRVFTLSSARDRMVVGTSGRHVLIYDLRKIDTATQPEQHRESSLKFQTRCVSCYPDGRGYALGSVEGRVAMEFFDLGAEAQAAKYAFKCHRRPENGVDTVYPVHSITFHPGYGTFATGGGDGVVNIWDGDNKKRLFQVSRYPSSVSAMAFSRDGSVLAVASSYAFERGEAPEGARPPPDSIYLRRMADAEVRPKARAAK